MSLIFCHFLSLLFIFLFLLYLPFLLLSSSFLLLIFALFSLFLLLCPSLFFFSLFSSPSSYLFILPYSSLCSPFPLLTPLFFSIILFVHFFYTCHYRYILKLTRNVFINLRLGDQPSLN